MTDLFGAARPLPAITLWQPFASLIFADGYPKAHETRGYRYPAKYEGQRVAIHAAKAFPAWKHISPELHELAVEMFGCQYHETLPLGRLLGTVRLSGCYPTHTITPDDDDRACGIWTPGRFAWGMTKRRPADVDLPCAGKQGWWVVPAELAERLAA